MKRGKKLRIFAERTRRNRRPWIVASSIAGAVVVLALISFFAFRASGTASAGTKLPSKPSVLDAWKSQDYQKTLEFCRSALATKPLDAFYLSFEGIASYYLSTTKPEGDERQTLLDESVASIRKAMATQAKIPVKAQIEYVLGKAYYQKGEPWYDLAVQYLERAEASGYRGKDTEQYLGLSYVGLGKYDKAASHFEQALKQDKSDLLMLSAATSYKELGDAVREKELLDQVVASASDAVVTQKARFLLAELAFKKGDLVGAKTLYLAIVDADPSSADAWYWLGVIYEAEKDPIRARSAWRKATAIDPNHIEARKKLAERL